jgi:hypothetical protein
MGEANVALKGEDSSMRRRASRRKGTKVMNCAPGRVHPGERARMSPVSSRVNIRGRSPPSRNSSKTRNTFVEAKRKERCEWQRYRY